MQLARLLVWFHVIYRVMSSSPSYSKYELNKKQYSRINNPVYSDRNEWIFVVVSSYDTHICKYIFTCTCTRLQKSKMFIYFMIFIRGQTIIRWNSCIIINIITRLCLWTWTILLFKHVCKLKANHNTYKGITPNWIYMH